MRRFTAEDDKQILEHVNGRLPLRALMKIVHSARETLDRRAHELGVKLNPRRRRVRIENRLVVVLLDHNKNPVSTMYRGKADRLLARLQQIYGEHNE